MGAQMVLYEPRGIGSERRITRKKTRRCISIHQVHISRATPSIDSVSVSFVRCRGSTNIHTLQLSNFTWRDSDRLPVTLFPKPLCYGRWSEQRDIVGERVERIEREVVRMGVRKQYGIELW